MSIPGQTMGVSVFTDYLIQALGVSRSGLSLAYMGGTIGSSLVLGLAGKFYDRWGARVTAVISGILLSFILVFLSRIVGIISGISNAFGYSGGGTGPVWLIFTIMVLSFFLLRFSGQGMLTVTSRNMVMKWFDKRRGMAAAVLGVSISFGFSYSPRIFQFLIDRSGWQGAWFRMGVFCLVIFVPLVMVFFRDNPWQCGLKPDSGKELFHSRVKKKRILPGPEKEYTLKEARRTRIFWTVNLLLAFHALFSTAFTFHIVSVFEAAGLSRQVAIGIFLPAAVISVIVNFAASWISDYISLKPLLILQGISLMTASLGLIVLDGAGSIFLILGSGTANGLMSVLSSVAFPRLFGTRHLGAVSGFSMGWVVAGSAVGPYIYSLIQDISGSYLPAYIAGGCVVTGLTVWTVFLRNSPGKEEQDTLPSGD